MTARHSSLSPGRRGLILMDYIISVAVIAVLASILFPVFAQTREAARKSSCRTNLHQIGLALHLYARDHDGRLPPGRYMTPLLGAYVPSSRVFACPSEGAGVQVGKSKVNTRSADLITWRDGRAVLPPGPMYCSYQYGGGLTLDSAGDTWVAGDWSFLHQNRALTLNLAGEVIPLQRIGWRAYALSPAPGNLGMSKEHFTPFLTEPGGGKAPTRPEAGQSTFTPGDMPGAIVPGGSGP